jgi:KDO2-lipid IV(A) lauroyltransferase
MNFKNAFPEKTATELHSLEVLFYHHFGDVVVETIKSFTMSREDILKRMVILNPELVNRYFDEGRSVLLSGAHFNNWEWIATGLAPQVMHEACALYKPLSNAFFERKLKSTRGKFGLHLVGIQDAVSFFESNKDKLTLTIFGIDQSPGHPDRCHWMQFLNQETGVQFGLEKFARELDFPVVFGKLNKVRRGYYTLELSLVTDTPRQHPYGWIIESATHMVEAEIKEAPQYWLWTHKRWKHRRPTNAPASPTPNI